MRKLGVLCVVLATGALIAVALKPPPQTDRTRADVAPKPQVSEADRFQQQAPKVVADAVASRTTVFRVTAEGHPLEDARILLRELGMTGTTDATGVVRIVHPDVDARYVVRKVGYYTELGQVGPKEVHVELVAGRPAHGRVVVAESLVPVVGARVRVLSNRGDEIDAVHADSNGAYTVSALSGAWPVRIVTTASGFAPVEVLAWTWRLPDVLMGAGGSISGALTDSSGSLLHDVVVVIAPFREAWRVKRRDAASSGQSAGEASLLLSHCRTDTEGRFRVVGLAVPGTYSVIAFGGPRLVARHYGIAVTEEQPHERIVLTLHRTAALQVEIASTEGVAIEGARVSVEDLDAHGFGYRRSKWRSETQTSWEFDDVPAGTYRVQVAVGGYRRREAEVTLAPGDKRRLEVLLDRALSISGTVTSGTGIGLARVVVEFIPNAEGDVLGNPDGGGALTRSDGAFVIRGLPDRAGRLVVEPFDDSSYAPTTIENVRAGQSGLRVVLLEAARIVGRMMPAAKGVRAACVTDDGARIGRSRASGSNGDFEVGRIEPGTPVRIVLSAPGYGTKTIDVGVLQQGETRDLGVVRVKHAVTLSATVTDEEGAPVSMARVTKYGERQTEVRADEQGRFQVSDLAPGDTVWVRASGFAQKAVRIEGAGSHDDVVIVLSSGGLLSGRVRDSLGNPARRQGVSLAVFQRGSGAGKDDPDRRGRFADFAEPDATSRYQVRLAPGEYYLEVDVLDDDERKKRVPFVIRKGQTTTLDITLP